MSLSMEKYNSELALRAWKQVLNTGVFDASLLRPEIARSWKRCLDFGVDPWSMDMPKQDMELLRYMREKYASVLEAFNPILQYLFMVFNCNISVANDQAFVFELLTPLSSYPRSLGTFTTEETVGNGNITIALHDNTPCRVDGYEHFRAYAQGYSGVATPVKAVCGGNYVLCMNNPFSPLPENALDSCVAAGNLVTQLARTRKEAFMHLSSASFFDPIIQSDTLAVIVTDPVGNILTANNIAKTYLHGYEKHPYGSIPLVNYLKDKSDLNYLIEENHSKQTYNITFKRAGRGKAESLRFVRSRRVELINGTVHLLLVFERIFDSPIVLKQERVEETIPNYLGESDEWKKVDSIVRSVAPFNVNVMITGETGTGKEVVAQALHRMSGRKGEFVAINCGGLTRELLSSELFGYERGAFTGARNTGSMGKFEFANGGTLFLDEIGEMPVDMQVSLLRVIQEQCITRIGANKSIPIDVRIITATNQDMKKLIAEGRFRSDLWYRLHVIEIHMPLLRERKGDVSLLASFFNEQLSRELNVKCLPLKQETLEVLDKYSWPGNVRELKNVMEKALIIANGKPISLEHLPENIRMYKTERCIIASTSSSASEEDKKKPLAKLEREKKEKEKIIRVLEEECGNISRSAKRLNISRNTLYRKIKQMNIQIKTKAL